jgi:hypothetical protein
LSKSLPLALSAGTLSSAGSGGGAARGSLRGSAIFGLVNVNTTDATTGATALLLPAQNTLC